MLRDTRSRALWSQTALLALVLGTVWLSASVLIQNLKARGIPLGFDFLFQRAGFTMSETFLSYSSDDPYWWAAIVGVGNTLYISTIVIMLSSVFGLLVGIGRLSSNPLVSGTSRVWVEIARNTPPVMLLILIYSIWWKILPQVQDAWTLAPGFYLSLRGLVTPKVSLGLSTWIYLAIAFCIPLLIYAQRKARLKLDITGRKPPYVILTLLGSFTVFLIYVFINKSNIGIDWPVRGPRNFSGGAELTPELTSIIIGLTFYTTGFVAEIIRAGILAIPKGQWEAARSVGLKPNKILRLIIIPQTLRIILPPLSSQYINVIKNSTLAIAIGYMDFLTVMQTVINLSSHAIEGIVIILVVYLVINLSFSAMMNYWNYRLTAIKR